MFQGFRDLKVYQLCGYLSQENHDKLISRYEEVGRILGAMIAKPERFLST